MFKMPHGIRLDPAGNVWTVDANTSQVFKFTPVGKKLLEITVGDEPDAARVFCGATDVAFAANGRIYVADRENGKVQWFTPDGAFLGPWKFGGQLYNVAFGTTGEMYVSTHPKNVSLDEEFDVVKVDPATGKMLGRFHVRSHELSIGPDGALFPATRSGQLLLFRLRQ